MAPPAGGRFQDFKRAHGAAAIWLATSAGGQPLPRQIIVLAVKTKKRKYRCYALVVSGMKRRDISLCLSGRLARLEWMPEKPREEVVVALAEPAVSVPIAVARSSVLGLTSGVPDPRVIQQTIGARSR